MDDKNILKTSFVFGGIAAAVIPAICVAVMINQNQELWKTILIALGVSVGSFTFVSQLFWGEVIPSFFFFFFKTFRAPMLIFTLDLDGLIWFICVKLLFAIIGFILTSLIFLLGLVLSMSLSIITFPFALTTYLKDEGEIK